MISSLTLYLADHFETANGFIANLLWFLWSLKLLVVDI